MFVWFGVTCDTCKDRYAQKHAKKLPTWYLVLSSRGKVSIEYPQPRVVILITLPSLQTTGSLGHRYGIRAYADLPAPLQILGNQRGDAFRDRTRKRFYKRNVRSEIRTRVLDDVQCDGNTF